MNLKNPRQAHLEQCSQALVTLMIFVMVLLLLQLWLVTVALEEYLAARHGLAIPTFAASCGCFLLNLWLLKYVYDIDRKSGDE